MICVILNKYWNFGKFVTTVYRRHMLICVAETRILESLDIYYRPAIIVIKKSLLTVQLENSIIELIYFSEIVSDTLFC